MNVIPVQLIKVRRGEIFFVLLVHLLDIMSLDVNISEPDEFNCTELHSCIKHVAEAKGIDDFVYHVDYVCGKGENFIANIFRVLIKETGNEANSCSVIVKTLINTARQALFHELHGREVTAYENVVSKFMEMQNCLEDDVKLVLCECIYARNEKSNEVIVLEDMELRGYRADSKIARYENIDNDHVTAVLSELAKFHALSFVFQNKNADAFDQIKTEMQDILFQNKFLNKSKLRNYFYESYETSVNLINDTEVRRKLEAVKGNILEFLQMYSKTGQTNVLCHGDCWINNVLFRYEDNKPTRVCFVDFQAMRYANPVTDVIYFIYLCTDSKFRSENFTNLQNVYHDSLKIFLNLYNIDVDDVYPKNEFENDLKDHLPFGLLIALVELRIISITPEYEFNEVVLSETDSEVEFNTAQVPGEANYLTYKINDVINESIENGVLDNFLSIIKNLK